MPSSNASRIEYLLSVLCISVLALVAVIIAGGNGLTAQYGTSQVSQVGGAPIAGQGGADITVPIVNIDSPVAGTVSGSVTISATAIDPAVLGQMTSGIASVQFIVDGVNLGAPLTAAPFNGIWNTLGVANGSHILIARATDNAGNAKISNAVYIYISNTLSLRSDTMAPTIPQGVYAAAVTPTQVNLSWNPSSDPIISGAVTSGVVGYQITRNNVDVMSVSGTSWSDVGVKPGIQYTYSVKALDATSPANASVRSAQTIVTTPQSAPDNGPIIQVGVPIAPLPAGSTEATLKVITDVAAFCRYSAAPSIPFTNMPSRFAVTGNTLHTTTVTGLTDGRTYTYYVKCNSASGASDTTDFIISFSVSSILSIGEQSINAPALPIPSPTPVPVPVGVIVPPVRTATTTGTSTASSTVTSPPLRGGNDSISRLSQSFQFPSPISVGSNSVYVKSLQEFLNDHGYAVAVSGPGSFGFETSFFGPATVAALATFQAANGISPAIGNFGPLTMAKVNQLLAAGK